MALVQGNSPAALIRSRMASSSLVYEVMHRFIDQALLGLADRREDNGEPKVTEQYEARVCPWKRPRRMRRLRAIRRLIQSVPNNAVIKETYHGLKKRNRTLQRHYAQKQAA